MPGDGAEGADYSLEQQARLSAGRFIASRRGFRKLQLGMQANSEDLVLLPLPLRFRAPAAQLHTVAAYNKIGTHEFCERMTKREASLHSRRRQRRLAARSG